ncbi:MAG: hypothetical protein HQL69_19275 [Magnetococcales bacterium]|nr:hypothetical protein [Magnetococcales bacterium]
MVYNNDEFNDCPQGDEADGFHERILDGLVDTVSEFEDKFLQIEQKTQENRSEDEEVYFSLYQKIQQGMVSIKNPDLTYDKKYEIAQKMREYINELELL